MEYGSLGFNVVAALIKIVFMILGFLMPLASILTWMERRQSAMMQDRLGPNRANIPLPWKWRGHRAQLKLAGILHFVADALKFMGKEDYVPGKAHKFLFMWAPIMAMAPALIVAAIIPFGPPLCWGELLQVGAVCSQPVSLLFQPGDFTDPVSHHPHQPLGELRHFLNHFRKLCRRKFKDAGIRDRPPRQYGLLHPRERQHSGDGARLERKDDSFAGQFTPHLKLPFKNHDHRVCWPARAQIHISRLKLDLLGVAEEPIQLVVGQTFKSGDA